MARKKLSMITQDEKLEPVIYGIILPVRFCCQLLIKAWKGSVQSIQQFKIHACVHAETLLGSKYKVPVPWWLQVRGGPTEV